ncbi:RING/FYVE/PHD zinc finger superfamily protein [Euphorbia peplus]|nr:RING/FYVE/PHD zinc finger superfamily protein [Euphorbia peplus]
MVNVCLTCGDEGVSDALTFCNKCNIYSVHLYCLPELPANLHDDVVWLCEDCEPDARKLFFLDKCSPDSESSANAQVKEKSSGRKLKKKSNREVSSVSLNSPEVPDLQKSSSIQLDSEYIKKDEEDERPNRMDDTFSSTYEAVESLEGKSALLELEIYVSDKRKKDEKHEVHVVLKEAESLKTNKTELDGQDIDLHEIASCKDREEYQNHTRSNNLDEVSLNAEARLLTNKNLQPITRSAEVVEMNYVPAQPIEQPIWRGHMCIPEDHFDGMLGLVAHLSNLACPRVSEEAKSLPLFLSPELLPKSTLWPKSFAKWGPSDDSIALYFFPDSESSERVYDSIVNVMMSRDLGMRVVLQNAELLIFTSTLMPMDFWRFQAKFYLWGVFRGKRSRRSAANAVPGYLANRQSPISPLSNGSSGLGSPVLSN